MEVERIDFGVADPLALFTMTLIYMESVTKRSPWQQHCKPSVRSTTKDIDGC